jgi:hypothetical protein
MLALEMVRGNRPGSTTASRLKQRRRDAHDVVLDAGERRLMRSVDHGEWTTVDGFSAAKAATRAPRPRLFDASATN